MPLLINHSINARNKRRIRAGLPEHFTPEEAKAAADAILHRFDPECEVQYFDTGIKIRRSYRVTSRRARQKVSEILRRADVTHREYDNLCAEWVFHNLCYRLHIRRASAADADLDYTGDQRRVVRAVTRVLEYLGWD